MSSLKREGKNVYNQKAVFASLTLLTQWWSGRECLRACLSSHSGYHLMDSDLHMHSRGVGARIYYIFVALRWCCVHGRHCNEQPVQTPKGRERDRLLLSSFSPRPITPNPWIFVPFCEKTNLETTLALCRLCACAWLFGSSGLSNIDTNCHNISVSVPVRLFDLQW